MAIDLEGIMNRIMSMVEKKQKDMPSGMQMYNDSQRKEKWDAIDKKDALNATIGVQKDALAQKDRADLLAHPAASLDSTGRSLYANATIGKMNADAQQSLGMAAHGYGSGKQAEATGNYQQAQADKQNMLMPVFQRMSNQDQAQALFDRLPERQNTAPVKEAEYNYLQSPQASNSIAIPLQTAPSYTNETVKASPREQELINGNTDLLGITDNQKVPGIFGSTARGVISGIDNTANLANYFGDSAKSFRRNLKNSNPNIFAGY